MKHLTVGLIAIAALVLGLPYAQASTVTKVIGCSPDHVLSDDPILFRNQPGASHQHQFYGAKGTNASSTPDSLVGTATSCQTVGDTAAYWVPTSSPVGFHLGEYWDNRFTPAAIQPIPFGAELVIGNGHVAGDGKASVFWTCSNGVKSIAPLPCDVSKLTLVVRFPNCYDGSGLANADFAYSSGGPSPIQFGTGNVCPAAFSVKIAELAMHIRLRNTAGDASIAFSSGDGSAHADFLNSWVPAAQCAFLKSFTTVLGC